MYGLGMMKGMMVTFKHIFKPATTVQYPEEVRPIPASFVERKSRDLAEFRADVNADKPELET